MSRRASPSIGRTDEASPLNSIPPTFKNVKEFPYGESLFPEIWEVDPTSSTLKSTYLALALASLVGLCFMSNILTPLFPGAASYWDEKNGADSGAILDFPLVMQKALNLPLETVNALFLVTGGVCVLLIIADVLTAGPETCKTHPFPASWKCDNTVCYHEMFSEPTRFGRLLRRPGNSLSNAPYLLACLCALASVAAQQLGSAENQKLYNPFWLADAEFGILLFLLALTSLLWHGTNAPWSQYPDIWSMDCCIVYLIVRNICMGILGCLWKYTSTNPETAKTVAGGACFVIYTVVVILGGQNKYSWYEKGTLHGSCPFAVRSRLAGKPSLGGEKKALSISELAIFAAMPFLYILIPMILQLFLLKSTGSRTSYDFLARTLVVGWTARLFDRWVLDGFPFINYFLAMKPGLVRTVGAAIFSPTGNLHFWTGLTLVCGYVHARTVDQSFDELMMSQ